jgi:cyclopropane fatty-acyl-phospholipid synthase-like methyltransferase
MECHYMPGRTFDEQLNFRKWIEAALADGKDSPSRVLDWIEQHKSKGTESPSLATVGRIMRDMGYEPTDVRWEQKKGKGS